MPRSLAGKLILSLTLIVVLVEGAFGLMNLRAQERQLVDGMILGADQLSRSITSATWHAMLADNRTAAYEVMETIASEHGIDRIRIFNKEGRITFSTAGDRAVQVDKRAEACFLCHAEETPLVRVDVPTRARIFRAESGARRLAMVTPIYNEPACSRAACHAHPAATSVLGVLDVALDLEPVDRELVRTRRRMLLVFAVQIGLIGLATVVLTRRLVGRPIRRLMEGTAAVGELELDRPIEVGTSGELQALAHSFNQMRERLRETLDQLNQLTQGLEHQVETRTAELRAAEQKLARSDRLASLGTLAATVAHEINNPVSGVLNLAKLLRRLLGEDGVPSERLEEFRRYLALVESETARVGRIVADLLSFSRQARPRADRVDLNAVVGSSLAMLAHRFRSGRVVLEQRLEAGLPEVRGDASQLQQVVVNIVANAVEALAGDGRVEVRTRLCRGRPVLEVADTGSGIAAADLPRIFDPFFTTKEEGKSLGLGLAVVYGIVEGHGGEVAVESDPGRGTTFRVTLPPAEGSTAAM